MIKLRCLKIVIIEPSLISVMRLLWQTIIANAHAWVNHAATRYADHCTTVVCRLPALQVMGVGISSGANCSWINNLATGECSSVELQQGWVVGYFELV